MLQQVDIVDQVQIDRTGTALATPIGGEIVVGLHEPGGALHGGDGAKRALVDQRLGLGDQRIVAAVMAGGQRHAARLCMGDQPGGAVDVGCERLFHQHRQAGVDTGHAAIRVQRVGRGQDSPIGEARVQHLCQRGEPGHVMGACDDAPGL